MENASASASVQLASQQLDVLKSLDESILDELARNGDTVLLEGIFTLDTTLPEMPGGWRLKLINGKPRPGRPNEAQGKVLLFAGTPRTRDLWVEGQRKLAIRAGLEESHVDAWLASKIPHKHGVLKQTAYIMRKPELVKAYLAWPKGQGDVAQREWAAEHDVRDNTPAQQRDTISAVIAELVHGVAKTEPRQPNAVMSKALQEALAKRNLEAHATKTDDALDECIDGNVAE